MTKHVITRRIELQLANDDNCYDALQAVSVDNAIDITGGMIIALSVIFIIIIVVFLSWSCHYCCPRYDSIAILVFKR